MVNDGNTSTSSNDKDNGIAHFQHKRDGNVSSNVEDDEKNKEYSGPGVDPETLH